MAYRKINASSTKPLKTEAELVREYLDSFLFLCDSYTKNTIYNFDETRFDWDVNTRHTYDFKGTSRILGVNSAKINHFITILLMIRADGKKLPALMIFKEKIGIIPFKVRENLNIPNNINVKRQNPGISMRAFYQII